MGIKNLVPRLPERGKIKIGRLGAERTSGRGKTFRMPEKLDHFLITRADRGSDGNFAVDRDAHQAFGEKPTELPVRLLYDDPELNFPTRYAAYKGRTLWCTGDGETALRLNDKGERAECVCPCPRADPAYKGEDKCKMNGKLSVLLDIPNKAGVGGVWTFRTTSYNSIVSIMSALQFLRALTGGPLAGIPMALRVQAKEGTTPDGTTQTVYFVSVEYVGSEEDLIERGQKVALQRATAKVSIEHIEERARQALRLAPPDVILPGDENEDVVDEFYSEQANSAPSRPTRSDYADAPEVHAETIEPEPDPEPVYDFIDEVGEILADDMTALDWINRYSEHLRRLRDAKTIDTFIENNDATAEQIIADGRVGDAADVISEATKAARERTKKATAPTAGNNLTVSGKGPDDWVDNFIAAVDLEPDVSSLAARQQANQKTLDRLKNDDASLWEKAMAAVRQRAEALTGGADDTTTDEEPETNDAPALYEDGDPGPGAPEGPSPWLVPYNENLPAGKLLPYLTEVKKKVEACKTPADWRAFEAANRKNLEHGHQKKGLAEAGKILAQIDEALS